MSSLIAERLGGSWTKFADNELLSYICPSGRSGGGLTHGVMVTQQILVLSFQVRVLVGQQVSLTIRGLSGIRA